MDAIEIASFYDDPLKRACDEKAVRAAERGRSLAVDTNLRTYLHRGLILLGSRVRGAFEGSRHRRDA